MLPHPNRGGSCNSRSECNTGPLTTDKPSQEADVSIQAPDTDQTEAFKRPAPGLGHRQKHRPVGIQPITQGPAASQSRQAPAPSEAQSVPQQPSVQSQSFPLPSQAPTQQPRAALQPLSALPLLPQAAAPAQAPVRHADFAGVQQQEQKSAANVQFWLTFHAEFGQRLRVVGSHKNLGALTASLGAYRRPNELLQPNPGSDCALHTKLLPFGMLEQDRFPHQSHMCTTYFPVTAVRF